MKDTHEGVNVRLARAQLIEPPLTRLAQSALLWDLQQHPASLDHWRAALRDPRVSTGERTALAWLSVRMWPEHTLGEGRVGWEDVVANCDRDLVQLLADAGAALTAHDVQRDAA